MFKVKLGKLDQLEYAKFNGGVQLSVFVGNYCSWANLTRNLTAFDQKYIFLANLLPEFKIDYLN